MRGTWRLRRWVRQITPKAVILLYHRVAEVPTDPQLLCVSRQHFAEHLEVLRRDYHLLSLRDLRRRQALNLWPPRSVVVTFDDGYADNFHNARPFLEAAGVPATVFVTAGNVDSDQEFWWDQLERILLSTPTLPDQLTLTLNGRVYDWDLRHDGVTEYVSSAWHVLMESDPTPRQAVYRELAGLLQGLDSDPRERVLRELATWAGVGGHGRKDYRALASDELQTLAHDSLIEVGAHTMTHPVLSNLPVEAQRAEIVGSKCRLEEVTGHCVTSFAYPFGTQGDYTTDTVTLVREAGFECACSNFPGLVTWESDPHQLPRLLVRDWDGEEFAHRMENWFAS
jgi:peptidoglycan/xylan/chitin deacetylase (PgdA/CDA1 family)